MAATRAGRQAVRRPLTMGIGRIRSHLLLTIETRAIRHHALLVRRQIAVIPLRLPTMEAADHPRRILTARLPHRAVMAGAVDRIQAVGVLIRAAVGAVDLTRVAGQAHIRGAVAAAAVRTRIAKAFPDETDERPDPTKVGRAFFLGGAGCTIGDDRLCPTTL